jgi:hypothetical protein
MESLVAIEEPPNFKTNKFPCVCKRTQAPEKRREKSYHKAKVSVGRPGASVRAEPAEKSDVRHTI